MDQTADGEHNKAFRAVRRALMTCKPCITGILTDTNSSVAELAPRKEHDISVCIKSMAEFFKWWINN